MAVSYRSDYSSDVYNFYTSVKFVATFCYEINELVY